MFYSNDLVFQTTISSCLAATDALFADKYNNYNQNLNCPCACHRLYRVEYANTACFLMSAMIYLKEALKEVSVMAPCSVKMLQSSRNCKRHCKRTTWYSDALCLRPSKSVLDALVSPTAVSMLSLFL